MKKIIMLSLLFLMVLASGSFATTYFPQSYTSQPFFDIKLNPVNPNKLVATVKGPNILVSFDGAKSGFTANWAKDATVTQIGYTQDKIFIVGDAGAETGKLYESSNYGVDFSDITGQLGANIKPLRDVAVWNGDVVVAGSKYYDKDKAIYESRVFWLKEGKWTRLSQFPAADYYCVAGRGNTVVAVGLEYFLAANRWDSTVYKYTIGEKDATLVTKLENVKITGVEFFNDDELIYSAAAGIAGIIDIANMTHTPLVTGTTQNLNAVAVYTPAGAQSSSIPSAAALGSGQIVMLAGGSGVIKQYDGTNTLKSMVSGTTADLMGIATRGLGYHFAVGGGGTVVLNLAPVPVQFVSLDNSTITTAPVMQTVSMSLTGDSMPPTFTLSVPNATVTNATWISPERIDLELAPMVVGSFTPTFTDDWGGVTLFAEPVTFTPRPTISRIYTPLPLGEIPRGEITLTIDGTGFIAEAGYEPTIAPMRSGVVVPGVSIDSVTRDSSTRITARVTIADTVGGGILTIRLTNPDYGTVDFDTTVSSDIYTAPSGKVWFDGKLYRAIYGTTVKYDAVSGGVGMVIKVKLNAANPINASSIVPKVDGKAFAAGAIRAQSYDPATGIYTTTLAEPLSTGLHTITIDATDDRGNSGSTTCQVRVSDKVQLVEGTVPVVSPTPVTGNKFTVVYSLSRSAPSIDVLIASPAGRIVTKKTFNTPDAEGVANGYSSGYNAVEIEVPSDLGKGIYPAKIVYGNQVVGKFYLVKQ